MKRILFVTNDFFPMIGGVANHVANLALALTRLGCEVKVLHICYDERFLLEKSFSEFEVIRVAAGRSLAGKTSFFAKLSRYFYSMTLGAEKLRELICSFEPDVIHWHDYYHSSLTTKLVRKRSCILICTNHASRFLEQIENGKFIRYILKFLVSHAHGIIGTSTELAEKSKFTKKIVRFIPNGVDEKLFKPTKASQKNICDEFGINKDTLFILAPRRLDPKNGLDVFIKALSIVKSEYPNVSFVIAGDGPSSLVREYKLLASELGVSSNLFMLGKIEYNRMPALISSADLVVIPSYIEAVSLAALEALACGVPVIASNVGGLPSVVTDKNGGLHIAGSEEDLAKTICCHLRDWPQTMRKGKAARASILKKHTWKQIAENTLSFYEDIRRDVLKSHKNC